MIQFYKYLEDQRQCSDKGQEQHLQFSSEINAKKG